MEMNEKSRTDTEVLEAFDKGYPEFKWFIEQYFPRWIRLIEFNRKNCRTWELINILNDVWFYLPDGIFNIMENPKGWKEFLNVIEE